MVSLAVIAHETQDYWAGRYQRGRWSCELNFRYPGEGLATWQADWAELEQNLNSLSPIL